MKPVKFITKINRRKSGKGFVMMEVLIALSMFAMVGTALIVALNDLGDLSFKMHRKSKLARILDSELLRAMSLPNLEAGKNSVTLAELGVELETLIEPLEEMENQDGQVLSNMFRIQVTAYWWFDGEYEKETTETWRYARLYAQ